MILINIAAVLGLVALSAFFVAAEYALLSIRRTRVEQLVQEGSSRAALIQKMLGNPGLLFSGVQLGITIASLLLGWIAEDTLAASLEGWLQTLLQQHASPIVVHSIAIVVVLLGITGLAVVLGELVPKTIGYERAEQVSLVVAWPMTLVLKSTRHFILSMDWVSNQILKLVGFRTGAGQSRHHTKEEVKLLVSSIRQRGLLGKEQEEMIFGAFDLHEILVREIMTPWPDVFRLPLTHHLPTLLDQVSKKLRSRIPIYEGSPDRVVGVLYPKDLLRVLRNRWQLSTPYDAPFHLRTVLREPIVVPENMAVDQLLEEYRSKRTQIALVVDEFGSFAGLVTLEDVLEEIVGEIEDEFDLPQEAVPDRGDGVLILRGSLTVRELDDDYDLELPRDEGFETLGGFLLSRLGFIPRGGENFAYDNHRFTVLEMGGRRITRVKIEPVSTPPGATRGTLSEGERGSEATPSPDASRPPSTRE